MDTIKTQSMVDQISDSADSGPTVKRKLPGQVVIGIVLIALTTLFPVFSSDVYLAHALIILNIYIAVAILQNFLLVDCGQFSFGSGAVFGVGAYVTAVAMNMHDLSYFAAAIVGTLAATLIGGLYALPALRVQGFYLGFVTFSVAMLFPEILVMLDTYTNGINGLPIFVQELEQKLLGDLSVIGLMSGVLAIATLLFYFWVRGTVLGRRMRVASESPEAAITLGISPALMRFLAFFIVAFGTGIAGAVYAPAVGFMTPSAFHHDISILFFFAVIVGGRGHYLGPFIGILVLYLIPNVLLAEFVDYRLLAYGVITLVVATLFPEGVVGFFSNKIRDLRNNKRDFGFSSEAIIRVLGAKTGHRDSSFTKDEPVAGPAVQIKGVSKSFGHVRAVDDVSFEIFPGHVHALIGANGSGKTTLLNILNGLAPADEGEININGKSTRGMAPYRVSELGLGRTFQTPRVIESIDAWQNLEIGIDARPSGSREIADEVQAIRSVLNGYEVGLVPHGQRRLLEVMRIVLKDANVILLDEPAAGLSPTEREDFKKLIRTLAHDYQKTVVLVEHDIDLIWDVADTITVLDAGKHIVTDNPEEVAANENVQHLFVGAAHVEG